MTATVKTMLYQLRKTAVDLTTAFSSSCNNQLQKSVFTVSAGYFAQIHPSFCVTKLWFVLTVNLGTQQFVVWSVVMIFLTPSHGLPCYVLKCLHFVLFFWTRFFVSQIEPIISHSWVSLDTALWELVLMGIYKWTSELLFVSLTSYKDSAVETWWCTVQGTFQK